MPRLSREVEDKITELIEQEYKDAEISRKLGIHRTTIANRRKAHFKRKPDEEKPETEKEENIQHEQPLDPQKYTRAHIDGLALSDIAVSRLYQIHELLDANSIEEMLETVYSDYVVAEKLWSEYKEYPSAKVSKTFAWVIAEEKDYAADLKHDLDIYMEGYKEDRELKEELKAEAEKQYEEGYQKGKNDHALLIPCTRCGKPCTITPGTESHWLIVDFCREQGIAHDDCIPRFKRIFVP